MTDAEAQTVVGTLAQATTKTLSSLPAQFLALVLLNVVFVITLLWFLQAHDVNRIEATRAVLNACTEALGRSAPVPIPR